MKYCLREDIERLFGAVNVAKWADLDADGDAVKVAANIDTALESAADEINDRMRGGHYLLPLRRAGTGSSSSSSNNEDVAWAPYTIRRVVAPAIAGGMLYEARGVLDQDPVTGEGIHRLRFHEKRAINILRAARAGARELDAMTIDSLSSAPEIVSDSPQGEYWSDGFSITPKG
jgi:hypothetical protein